MVKRVTAGRGGWRLGGIAGHPLVKTAAAALLLGVSDPLALLCTDPEDWPLLVSILEAATKMHAEMRKIEIEATGAAVGSKVAEAISRMFR